MRKLARARALFSKREALLLFPGLLRTLRLREAPGSRTSSMAPRALWLAAAFLLGAAPPRAGVAEAQLVANAPGRPHELNATTDLCTGRTARVHRCSVLLDVPAACATDSSSPSSACPIVLLLHDEGSTGRGFVAASPFVHGAKVIAVAPTADDGWNGDGDRPGNACKPNEYLCSTDNDEQKFMRKIVALLVTNGAKGSLFAYGEGGGAQLAQQLAVNADASLPVKGIWAAAGQLLAAPARSGPGQRNFNQPNASRGTPRQVAQCASHGTADSVVPYGGGRSALHKLCGECRLMTEPASDKTWALANGCSGQLTSTAVRATYRSPRPSGKPLTVETTAVHHVWGGCPAAAPVSTSRSRTRRTAASRRSAARPWWRWRSRGSRGWRRRWRPRSRRRAATSTWRSRRSCVGLRCWSCAASCSRVSARRAEAVFCDHQHLRWFVPLMSTQPSQPVLWHFCSNDHVLPRSLNSCS